METYTTEFVIHPAKTHYRRSDMPQIHDADGFIRWLSHHRIHHHKRQVRPERLLPTQNELNLDLVFDLIHRGLDTVSHPLLAARDRHILDGHNRWYAAKTEMVPVEVYFIDLGIDALIHRAFSFPGVKRNTIVEE